MSSFGEKMKVARGDTYVINRYETYLQQRDPALERHYMLQLLGRPPRNREGTWSASSAGRCEREQQLTFLGFPKLLAKEKTLNIFANGEYVHLRHQAFGMAAGYVTAAEVPVELPSWRLKGTMDGLLDTGDILEIKSIHTMGFSEVRSYGPEPEHVLQVHSYMLADDRDRARILYEDKNTQALAEFLVVRDETKITQILRDLDRLNDNADTKTLAPMLRECKNGKGRFHQCPHRDICESAVWPQQRYPIRISSSSARS